MQVWGGRELQAEGSASVKALGQESSSMFKDYQGSEASVGKTRMSEGEQLADGQRENGNVEAQRALQDVVVFGSYFE